MWKFVSWSDGGAPEHDVIAPVGGSDFRVVATFEVLGHGADHQQPAGPHDVGRWRNLHHALHIRPRMRVRP